MAGKNHNSNLIQLGTNKIKNVNSKYVDPLTIFVHGTFSKPRDADIVNVYDKSDLVQLFGGSILAKRKIDYGKNIRVNPSNKLNKWSIISPLPAYLKDELVSDHSNLDSKEIWSEIYERDNKN